MKFGLSLLCLCVVVVSSASVASAASAYPGKHVALQAVEKSSDVDISPRANMNEYFDVMLDQVRLYFLENGYVPMILPDSKHGFCIRVLFVDWHGELELTNGWLLDLTTIERRGDAELIYGDKVMTVKAVIGFTFLQLHYDYIAYVMNIGPDGGIEGTVKDVTFDCEIVIDIATGKAHVDKLKVLSTGYLDIKFTGTIIIDQIANAIADIITFLFKNVIMDMIALVLKLAINSALDNWVPPVSTLALSLQ